MSAERWQTLLTQMVEAGLLDDTADHDLETAYTTRFLP
jgi:hypothetical protein